MNEFWNNISRYPRFFISSFVGLILVILAPLKTVLKFKESNMFLLVLLGLLVFLFYIILRDMTAYN